LWAKALLERANRERYGAGKKAYICFNKAWYVDFLANA
jgi:hypothetical protein